MTAMGDRILTTIAETAEAFGLGVLTVRNLTGTAPQALSFSTPAERLPRETVALDPLEEALVQLARSALRNRREVAERRGKMAAVEGGKQGGRTA